MFGVLIMVWFNGYMQLSNLLEVSAAVLFFGFPSSAQEPLWYGNTHHTKQVDRC